MKFLRTRILFFKVALELIEEQKGAEILRFYQLSLYWKLLGSLCPPNGRSRSFYLHHIPSR